MTAIYASKTVQIKPYQKLRKNKMVTINRKGKEDRSLSHENEKCVGCGICSDICPTESIKLGPILPIARGLLQMDYININKDSCVLCGLCASACPFDALDFTVNSKNSKEMQNYPKWENEACINEEECIYCGSCVKACPKDAIFLNRVLPKVEDLVRGEAEIDLDKCIYCGMCSEMCPAEAITIKENDINSSKQSIASDIEIDESKCIYCGICKRICPEDAIKIVCTTCMERDMIETPEITGEIILDDDKCITCGWCEDICPVDAATVTKPFEGEVIINETETECKGDSCHACADVCPCNAISIVDSKSSVNPNMCTLCGACVKACPQKIVSVKRSDMKLKNIRSKSWNRMLGSLIE
jgi:4Fe-4S ferredoxin